MPVRGGRIFLRALEPEDIDLVFGIENDEELWQASAGNIPLSRFAVRNFLANTSNDIYTDKELRLVICLADSATPVGLADITGFEPRYARGEVGITVLRQHRGVGVAGEALEILGRYAWRELQMRVLYAIVRSGNAAAEKLFEGAGYSRVAVLPQWLTTASLEADAVLYEKILAFGKR